MSKEKKTSFIFRPFFYFQAYLKELITFKKTALTHRATFHLDYTAYHHGNINKIC